MGVFIKQKRVTVATAGTRVQLDNALKTPSIIITAGVDNTGTIYVGDINVDALIQLGQPLSPNESLELSPPTQYGTNEQLDLSKFYIDSTSNNDVIIVSWYERDGGSA